MLGNVVNKTRKKICCVNSSKKQKQNNIKINFLNSRKIHNSTSLKYTTNNNNNNIKDELINNPNIKESKRKQLKKEETWDPKNKFELDSRVGQLFYSAFHFVVEKHQNKGLNIGAAATTTTGGGAETNNTPSSTTLDSTSTNTIMHQVDKDIQASGRVAEDKLHEHIANLALINPHHFNQTISKYFKGITSSMSGNTFNASNTFPSSTNETPTVDNPQLFWDLSNSLFFDKLLTGKLVRDDDTINTLNNYKSTYASKITEHVQHELDMVLKEQHNVNEQIRDMDDFLENTRAIKKPCLFCTSERHDYPLEPMNAPLLVKFMNAAGNILPRSSTALCRRHQARVARTIKWARQLNVFTYKGSEFSINNPFKSVDTHHSGVYMKTTKWGSDDPFGLVAKRQQQVRKNRPSVDL